MSYEQQPGTGEHNEYYAKYIRLVPDGDIIAILATQLEDTLVPIRELTEEQARFAYAPGKWSLKEVLGHLADTERVFAYRALRIARGDTTPLASFDEKAYTPTGRFDERPLASLLAELSAVRRATVALFAGLPAEAWQRFGTASENPVTVRACAWIIAGHELHHRNVLAQNYLPHLPPAHAARHAAVAAPPGSD
jgi:uncharacterized damage-inducible protein DinB